jgi:hypothetical protein
MATSGKGPGVVRYNVQTALERVDMRLDEVTIHLRLCGP